MMVAFAIPDRLTFYYRNKKGDSCAISF